MSAAHSNYVDPHTVAQRSSDERSSRKALNDAATAFRIAVCLFGNTGAADAHGNHVAASGRFRAEITTGRPYQELQAMPPARGYTHLKTHILDHYSHTVFLHSWSAPLREELLRMYQPAAYHIEQQRAFNEDLASYGIDATELNPAMWRVSPRAANVYNVSTWLSYERLLMARGNNVTYVLEELAKTAFNSASHWYSVQQVIRLMQEFEREQQVRHDLVLLLRFDTHRTFTESFVHKLGPLEHLDRRFLYAEHRRRRDEDDAVNDLWFVSNSSVATRVFGTLFDQRHQYSIIAPYSAREHIRVTAGESVLRLI